MHQNIKKLTSTVRHVENIAILRQEKLNALAHAHTRARGEHPIWQGIETEPGPEDIPHIEHMIAGLEKTALQAAKSALKELNKIIRELEN